MTDTRIDIETEAENVVLFVSDALRLDYGREYLVDEYDLPGTFARGVAQGPGTPSSFPTIVSGIGPDEHGVSKFEDDGIEKPTVFDLDQRGYDVGYFDHPNDPVNRLLGNPPNQELNELEPPFVYVEREVATHTPYGTNWHIEAEKGDPVDIGPEPGEPRAYPHYSGYADDEWDNGKEYISLMQQGAVDFEEAYRQGCEIAVDRFLDHVAYLESEAVLDDTFVIFTADHGEVWGHHDGYRRKWIHNVVCPEVIEVPVLFYDRDVEVDEPVALKDLVRYWCPEWDDIRTEIDADHGDITFRDFESQEEDEIERRLKDLGYL